MLWLALLLNSTHAAVSALDPNMVMREYDFNAVTRVQIDNVAGKITVTPMTAAKIVAHAYKRKFSEKCVLTMEKEGFELLHLRVDGPSFEECEVDLDVHVPKDVDVTINAGAGRVNVDGLEGALEFRLGSGSVVANGKFKRVEGSSGVGSVDVRGIDGGGRVDSQGGAVTLAFTEGARGHFAVSTTSGSAEVQLPKGVKIEADLESASGLTTNEIGSYTRTELRLSLRSETGNLKVKSY